ncbi:proprotein convertase subtilisin/kexin type 4-like [Dendronephthya gigantea]|uniref:proprotein convertase subtilisin/kexin type 4-like n=1 Tax=Dendronephthya gigantea TaxID=151771 RepID=UPI001068F32F|nr:proprotein convertase subtilisin/kexin type 4-like [Dendronephthya gigantea]
MEAFTNVGYLAVWMILLLSISRENEGSQYNRNRGSQSTPRGYKIVERNGKHFVVFTNQGNQKNQQLRGSQRNQQQRSTPRGYKIVERNGKHFVVFTNQGSQRNEQQRSTPRGYKIVERNGKHFVVFTNQGNQRNQQLRVNRARFNDPNWGYQQYMGSSRIRAAHRIDDVWRNGYTGKNITVAVVDDGIKYTHKEFEGRYLPRLSYDYVDQDSDPTPSDSHGTKCAGVIAGAANNRICGVGVAYEANVAGIRLIDRGLPNDRNTAKAFYPFDGHKIDIFSNSWGPPDSGLVIAGPGPLSLAALRKGANEGRGGLGSIYVFSAGNGGFFGDSCAFNGFVNNIYTIAVGAVDRYGKPLSSSEACGSVMTSAYGVNLETASSYNDYSCDSRFGATSGATALVSGVIALTLEAKKTLTWRQVQHLIVASSMSDVIDKSVKWTVNKAGFRVSDKVGFGFLNASQMVENARKFSALPRQIKCEVELQIGASGYKRLLGRRDNSFDIEVGRDQCRGGVINYLEHVEARFDLQYFRRGVIGAYITSPGGTESQVIFPRSLDAYAGQRRYNNLKTVSVHFWGESSEGTWTVTFRNDLRRFPELEGGWLFGFTLILHGTARRPSFPEIPRGNLHEKRKPRVFNSCKEIKESQSSSTSGLYQISVGQNQKTGVYCQMSSIPGCSGGGWTMVMKIDGRKETFRYSSSYWTNKNAYNDNDRGKKGGFDNTEFKGQTFWKTSFNEICVVMKYGRQLRGLSFTHRASSLYNLFADGRYQQTHIGRSNWRHLIYRSSLQRHCNREGFNVYSNYKNVRVRLGLIANQQRHCGSPDSFIGLGGGGIQQHCSTRIATLNTAGNYAICQPDNGEKNAKAMGYLLIR